MPSPVLQAMATRQFSRIQRSALKRCLEIAQRCLELVGTGLESAAVIVCLGSCALPSAIMSARGAGVVAFVDVECELAEDALDLRLVAVGSWRRTSR